MDMTDQRNYSLVEDLNGEYLSVKIKQIYNSNQIELIRYFKSKRLYTFFFSLTNSEDRTFTKCTYFCTQLTYM